MWKARICGVLRLNKSMRVALCRISTGLPLWRCCTWRICGVGTALESGMGKSYAMCANWVNEALNSHHMCLFYKLIIGLLWH
jgi:hypothetical protein